MPPGQFDALQDGDGESSSSEDDAAKSAATPKRVDQHVNVPSYEDLSVSRADEETVLMAVYGDDFSREDGVWGCARLNVHCRPPDADRVGCELTLSVQLGKKYPYVVPAVEFRNIKGLSSKQQAELASLLKARADECASSGSVMMIELVQVTEDFLVVHNHDPNMSAWEQMKAREAMEEDDRNREEREKEAAFRELIQNETSAGELESPTIHKRFEKMDGAVEKELARHLEAFRRAGKRKQGDLAYPDLTRATSGGDVLGTADEEDDDEFGEEDDDDEEDPILDSSRYRTDFVELGLLGRGGGGEVVKVRNRLDKRIYAIKKIILESEEGKHAKFGVVQNRKLRREVTTVSRMMHKNIVRYYQGWVEGGEAGKSPAPEKVEEESDESDEQSSSSGESESGGWWTNSPLMSGLPGRIKDEETKQSAAADSKSDQWQGDDSDSDSSESSQSESLDNEVGHNFHSPLMIGMGFQNEMYEGLFNKRKTSSARPVKNEEPAEDSLWDESSVKVDEALGHRILYIQMEYCNTTLRKVIDEAIENPVEETEKWRMIRQIVEALVYIHGQNLIHRDLKPGNIFIDLEGNIRLGDFGLATRHSTKPTADSKDEQSEEVSTIYSAIEDISNLLGGSKANSAVSKASAWEALTGGVGTTFYRAPEQEGGKPGGRDEGRYDVQADIFSLGIVVFELFHKPFDTYMERAEILNKLRGEGSSRQAPQEIAFKPSDNNFPWQKLAAERFPVSFVESAPEAVQKIILWCLQRDPSKRPSADDLLSSDLLPRKMELEQIYLEEALHTLANPQSESYLQILGALFGRPTSDLVEVIFDTDSAAKANNLGAPAGPDTDRRRQSPSMAIMKAISNIRATGSLDIDSLRSVAMSSSSLLSATAALRRAKQAGKIGKGGKGIMKRATQRAAGILAMSAATSAAVTGLVDGVHGADPRVVENVCSKLTSIFGVHGAVHLRSPLLRPRPNTGPSGSAGGPAEVMNSRGTVLLLPEDLTASFARAVGRGGAATSNIKRYDIGRVYHKSLVGGHPRESLEASFDITHENFDINSVNIEAEAILVLSHAMAIIAPNRKEKIETPMIDGSPIWYLRLSHTRLTDSLLEVCGVPSKESMRRQCLQMITQFTAPTPQAALSASGSRHKRSRSTSEGSGGDVVRTLAEKLDGKISSLIENGLPRSAAQRLHMFLSSGCCPLSADLEDAVSSILRAVGNLRLLDTNSNADPRRLKRYDDIGRSAKHLKDLCHVLKMIGVKPYIHGQYQKQPDFADNDQVSRPLYICLDLGLRQRRRHFSQLCFQALLIPPSMLNPDTSQKLEESEIGVKVAEGGRYDDLVRRYRPPGNFGSALVSFYTNASIPICVGVRFAIGKLVESLYVASTLSLATSSGDTDGNHKFVSDADGIEFLRKSLGHPLHASSSVQVIVASASGMDADSVSERLIVASHLWANGISAEYLTHSGVMISLLQPRLKDESTASDWSLEELCGVCGIMKIPYVVIVQPHLLRDKGSVRLRHIQFDTHVPGSNSGSAEQFVRLESLAGTIQSSFSDDADHSNEQNEDLHHHPFDGAAGSTQRATSRSSSSVECIYVETDQYWGSEKQITKSDSHNYKAIMKSVKSITQRSEAYLDAMNGSSSSPQPAPVVVAADLPFWVLREFGTTLMRQGGQSAMPTSVETTERYPKFKRILKTLSMAIDTTMKKHGYWNDKGDTQSRKHDLFTIFLYSRLDDRFDMISLGDDGNTQPGGFESNEHKRGSRRHDRRKI